MEEQFDVEVDHGTTNHPREEEEGEDTPDRELVPEEEGKGESDNAECNKEDG